MNRKERYEALRVAWKATPISYGSCDDSKFTSWQGHVSALLSYNSTLQSEFRDAVRPYTFRMHSSDVEPMEARIHTIISQAIHELRIPEETTAPVLTDEHGIWWFINHCSWSVKVWLLLGIASYSIAVFGAGLQTGMTNIAKTLYAQWHNLPTATATPAPTRPQPNK